MDEWMLTFLIIKILGVLFILLIGNLLFEFMHLEQKIRWMLTSCMISTLLHACFFEFSWMYITYAITFLCWLLCTCYCCYRLLRKKQSLMVIIPLLLFLFSTLCPVFGTTRKYYTFKPIFLLNAKHVLDGGDNLTFLTKRISYNIMVIDNKVYYHLSDGVTLKDFGGIVVYFDGKPEHSGLLKDEAINFYEIDDNACQFSRKIRQSSIFNDWETLD